MFRWPFLEAVDVVALEIPDYNHVVTSPMDLGTIGAAFEVCVYVYTNLFICVRYVTRICVTRFTSPMDLGTIGAAFEVCYTYMYIRICVYVYTNLFYMCVFVCTIS